MEPDELEPGTIIAGFSLQLPLDDETCRAHIAASLACSLPEAVNRAGITVVANGPSARDVDLSIITGTTLAVNGAIRLFTDKGLSPTFWACCDPQAIVADFLPDNPPKNTVYFVASKCHPSVFEKLKDRHVRIWHVMDHPVEGRSNIVASHSITMSAAWLMHRLGYTDMDFYGWDGCFTGTRHHASDDSVWDPDKTIWLNYGGQIIDGEIIGGRAYATTRAWAAEAKGAEQFFQVAKYFDINVILHGDGMFKCTQESILSTPA